MGIKLFYGLSRPSITSDNPKASAYYQTACASRTAAIALFETDLRVRWSNSMFGEVVSCSGNESTRQGIACFLAATRLREQVLDVFTSGREKETFLSLPNHLTRRYWRGVVLGCQKEKPKKVLMILQPCITIIQFESDTGHITWRNEQGLDKLCPPQSCETGREIWAGQPFQEIDWNELVVNELKSPHGTWSTAVEIGGCGREKKRIRFVASTR